MAINVCGYEIRFDFVYSVEKNNTDTTGVTALPQCMNRLVAHASSGKNSGSQTQRLAVLWSTGSVTQVPWPWQVTSLVQFADMKMMKGAETMTGARPK